MRQWTLTAAAFGLLAAALWHLPATAQRSIASDNTEAIRAPAPIARSSIEPPAVPRPGLAAARPNAVSSEPITFADYREFRLRDIARRQLRLERELATAGLSPERRADLEARKAYYDQLAAMTAADRDRLFRTRFDQIDTDHDGTIDPAERAAWRSKQSQRYHARPALANAGDDPDRR